jgi:sulfite oxidase
MTQSQIDDRRIPRRLIHDPEALNTGVWPVSGDQFITPVEYFFTRSHAAVPHIDLGTWRLEVGGLVERPASFSFEELMRAFPRQELAATLVCAGLRRDEFLSLGPLPGELPWGPEPASTGVWAGIALRDVLSAVGVSSRAKHVELVGLDRVERHGRQFGFGGSIDLGKALAGEVILACELNGAPLPAAHGFPLRAVVPGWIGARSVKWLGRIALSEEPSANYFQSKAYRVQREISPKDPRDVSAGVAMAEVPLNAVILEPVRDQVVPAGLVVLRGWAMGAGGRPVVGVEVSGNGGQNWQTAQVSQREARGTWAFWEAELDLRPGEHTLAVRADDGTGAVQPSSVDQAWNVKGYGNNAWHRVPIRVE